MGINFLRKPSSYIKKRKNLSSNFTNNPVEKRAHTRLVSKNKKLRVDEFFVGNLNGFVVTKILEIRADSRKSETKVTFEKRVFLRAKRSTSNRRRTFDDPQTKMVKVGSLFSRKRKVPSPEKLVQPNDLNDFESATCFKKIKMESQPTAVESERTCLVDTPQPRRRLIRPSDPDSGQHHEEKIGQTASGPFMKLPSSPVGSPVGLKKNPWSFSSSEEPGSGSPLKKRCIRVEEVCSEKPSPETYINSYYEDFNRGWQTNFLRKCAELVEVRFSSAIQITCVKPFYERYDACWTASWEGVQLEASTQKNHQEYQGSLNVFLSSEDLFNRQETITLIRNFFNISRAYNLKHPYLLASIQTGLETRKDLFDFNKFRVAQQIVPKLCVDIPGRTAIACVLQLRLILAPRLLPFDQKKTGKIISHLFAGFGPDWLTVSKLTGLDQFTLKATIAAQHSLNASVVSPQAWFLIHQQMLNNKELAPGVPQDRQISTNSFLKSTPSVCRTSHCDSESSNNALPSFGRLLCSLRTVNMPSERIL